MGSGLGLAGLAGLSDLSRLASIREPSLDQRILEERARLIAGLSGASDRERIDM